MKKCCLLLLFSASLLCSCVSQKKYNNDINDLQDKLRIFEELVSRLDDRKEDLEIEVEELDDIIERASTELKRADYYFLLEEYDFAALSVSNARRILNER